jgi:hypothetical protein
VKPVEVGQIIYILDNKKKALVPARVFEQVTSRTIQGKHIHHVLQLPKGIRKDFEQVVLEKLSVPWFPDTESAKNFLLKEAEELINKAVLVAEDMSRECFLLEADSAQVVDQTNNEKDPQLAAEQIKLKMDLGDGTIGNITVPKDLLNENFNH